MNVKDLKYIENNNFLFSAKKNQRIKNSRLLFSFVEKTILLEFYKEMYHHQNLRQTVC